MVELNYRWCQCGLDIMGSSASNMVKEMADYEGLVILFKEIGKMPATAAGRSPIVILERDFGFCLVVFIDTILKTIERKLTTQKVHSVLLCEKGVHSWLCLWNVCEWR